MNNKKSMRDVAIDATWLIDKEISNLKKAIKQAEQINRQFCECQKLLYIKIKKTLVIGIIFISLCSTGYPLTASWYSVESCKREGTSGIMANGYALRDDLLACASWDFPFNSLLRITNTDNGKSVIVYVGDRGPAKKLYKQGRTIDLSVRAFQKIADLKDGVVPIKVELLKRG